MNPASKSEPPLKRRLREASREAILEAAEALLTEQGLHGARMEDIAARAGVSVGTIYNHVGDRQVLLDALFAAKRAELVSRMDAVLAHTDEAPFDALLESFVSAVFAHFDLHLPLFRLVIEEEMSAARAEGQRSTMRLLVERTERLVDLGISEGILRSQDRALYPALLVGIMRGVLAQALHGGHRAPVSSDVSAVVRFFLDGARRQP